MRQRIMIGLGIVLRPRLVVADEPTTALDTLVQAQILEILRGLAETLKDSVRTSDVVYRLGGEEFAVVVAAPSPQNAERLAHRLVDRVAGTDFEPAGRITIRRRIGI